MSPRYAARTDANHAEIVQAWLAVGATVESTATLGKDRPDALVGFRGANYWFEIKNPAYRSDKRGRHGAWHARWNGHVQTVWTVDEALAAIGAIELARGDAR